jgi:eukaryotic-like serine/threonine-protein kinase
MVGRGRMLAGRYRLDELVGSGGAGQVWRAVDLVLERPVAVKLLWPDAAGDPVARARFRAEARHASCLSHPGVAQVHDYGECGPEDTPFLVLELVDGSSLAGVLAAGPLDPADTIDVIAQVAAGLQAAHSAGLVHRDIKPANLLVGRDGQVKITDFGLASVTGSASVTTTGVVVGTAAYLAPERAAGEPATAASDLYSLGVVGYHCLTGRPPFCGPPAEVALAHLQHPFPPLPDSVPAGLRELVAALMEKEPADRPGSAGEVCRRAEILRAAHATRAARLRAVSPPARSGPGTADQAPTLAQASRAALQEDRQPPIRTSTGAARHRMRWMLIAAGLAISAAMIAAGAARWKTPVTGATRPHTVARPNPPASHPAPAIAVNAASLTGRPVGAVLAQLRRLGLRPGLVWVPSSAQPAGTVLQVQPAGTLPRGTTVTVTAASQPPQPSDRHGGGNSNGGHGKGNNGNNSAGGN